ncbi:MAG: hypothetical protein SNJ71_00060 [Bacteroidales bacterium]
MKYVITSKYLEGSITLDYDDATGMLIMAAFDFIPTSEQAHWLARNFPTTIDILKHIQKQMRGGTVEQIIEQPTFELFWRTYDHKVGKQEAERAWAKLTLTEQIKAIKYINRYKQELPNWQAMLMPASYLNKKRYLDFL